MVQWYRFGAIAALLLGSAALATHGYAGVARELATPRSLSATAYVGSDACRTCHPDHTESFRRTFHRTMTQEAGEHSVLGDFDAGATLDYFGVRARMTRGPAGEFLMDFAAARSGGTERWQARVERTVGSRRYQQYLARDGDVYFRLPIAWDVAEQRFFHMNGAFLTPDPPEPPPGGSITPRDYNRHVTRWNDNCVFCHNVRPNPGLDPATGEFDTRVAELGIACEACHGPGAEHVARNVNPLRRYALQLSERVDPSIRNPAHMTGARSAEVCGRCHGQRITGDLDRFLTSGDSYVPGDPLAEQSRPLFRDTTQNGEAGLFAPRFWNDGTARLTAYEYQGYLQSACGRAEQFSCESCHAMHQGDPRGQLHPERVGDAACTQCHSELAGATAQRAHSHHDPAGSGGRCISCHMPEIVYGLVTVHVSHRIERPDPAAAARANRPDACTLCHVDRSRAWAIDSFERWFAPSPSPAVPRAPAPAATSGDRSTPTYAHVPTPSSATTGSTASTAATPPIAPVHGPSTAVYAHAPTEHDANRDAARHATTASRTSSAAYAHAPTEHEASRNAAVEANAAGGGEALAWNARQLFAGDPIERAVAAHALGEPGAEAGPTHAAHAIDMLANVLETDPYPAVRAIALRSLRALTRRHAPELAPLLAAYSPTAEPTRRRESLAPLQAARSRTAPAADSPAAYPDAARRALLRTEAAQAAIEIGE